MGSAINHVRVRDDVPVVRVNDHPASKALVEEGLAACVNLAPGITSIYHWEGKLCQNSEVLMLAKTLPDRLEAFEARVKALHSYTVPEILALSVRAGSKDYLKWVGEVCG